jgi:Domain of unknown function (DUF4261)
MSFQTDTAEPATGSAGPCVLILLDRPIRLSPTKMESCFAERHPGIDNAFADHTESGGKLWRIGKYLFAVMNFDVPIPSGWEPLAIRAKSSWPQAQEACAQHRAHIVLSAFGIQDSKLQTSSHTAAAVDAIVHAYPEAIAVVWGVAVIQPREAYEAVEREVLGEHLPFPLWIGLHSFYDERQNIVAMTIGLNYFIDREIEIEGPAKDASDLHQTMLGLIHYCLTTDSPVKDGDTIGANENERLTLIFRRSVWTGAPVLALSLPGTIPATLNAYPIISHAMAQADPLLQSLSELGLFDVEAKSNQVELQADIYMSEERLDPYERGVQAFLSEISVSSHYQQSEADARKALDSGDVSTAKAILAPYAEQVGTVQQTLRSALEKGDVFLFEPRVAPASQ